MMTNQEIVDRILAIARDPGISKEASCLLLGVAACIQGGSAQAMLDHLSPFMSAEEARLRLLIAKRDAARN